MKPVIQSRKGQKEWKEHKAEDKLRVSQAQMDSQIPRLADKISQQVNRAEILHPAMPGGTRSTT